MDTIWRISWPDLLFPKPTWAEKAVRPLLVYVLLLLLFRIGSKREIAQATMFDFLIVLLISNVVQNAMIGDDNSVLGAALGALVLVALSAALNRITARNRKARRILEGQPVLLVQQGDINETMMRRYDVSRNDLLSAVRKQGVARLCNVAYAVLELDGTISVIKTDDDERPHDCLPVEIVGRESAESAEDPS